MTLLWSQCWEVGISLLALVLLYTGRTVYDLNSVYTMIEYLCTDHPLPPAMFSSWLEKRNKNPSSCVFFYSIIWIAFLEGLGNVCPGYIDVFVFYCLIFPGESLTCKERSECQSQSGLLRTNVARFPPFRD